MTVPACVLAAAYFLVPVVSELPASLAGLKAYGAYIVLALGASVSLVFRRGRVVLALPTRISARSCCRAEAALRPVLRQARPLDTAIAAALAAGAAEETADLLAQERAHAQGSDRLLLFRP